MEDDNNQATSHKGEKRNSYTMEFKKKVLKFAQENSIRKAAAKFNIDRKRIREWNLNKDKIVVTKPKRQRLDGAGRKIQSQDMEEEILRRIFERRSKMLRVSRKLIMIKAKAIHDEISGENTALRDSFIASTGWLQKFMKRNNLSNR